MHQSLKYQNKAGFTLVELIIVISIISVLAAVAFIALSGETSHARDAKRVADIKTFEAAVGTSNGKNKPIEYRFDKIGLKHDGTERTDTKKDTLASNAGVLKPIRGASLVPVTINLFDSDVIPKEIRDPKGSNYIGTFMSKTKYSFYATKENPDTEKQTALVVGSFMEGMNLDVLMENVGGAALNKWIRVSNPERFVRGDVIKIQDEYMVVIERKLIAGELKVDRGYDPNVDNIDATTIAMHNKSSDIKLMYSSIGADSLLCISSIDKVATLTGVPENIPNELFSKGPYVISPASLPNDTDIVGEICKDGNPVKNDGTVTPYNID